MVRASRTDVWGADGAPSRDRHSVRCVWGEEGTNGSMNEVCMTTNDVYQKNGSSVVLIFLLLLERGSVELYLSSTRLLERGSLCSVYSCFPAAEALQPQRLRLCERGAPDQLSSRPARGKANREEMRIEVWLVRQGMMCRRGIALSAQPPGGRRTLDWPWAFQGVGRRRRLHFFTYNGK